MLSLGVLFFFCFFFSSRRRHTRSLRDWSSDVCSSDLATSTPATSRPTWRRRRAGSGAPARAPGRAAPPRRGRRRCPRSEERRVGKECRSRWAPCHEKEKSKNKCVVDRGKQTG